MIARLLALYVLGGGIVAILAITATFMVGHTPHWLPCLFGAVATIGGLYMVGNPTADPYPGGRTAQRRPSTRNAA